MVKKVFLSFALVFCVGTLGASLRASAEEVLVNAELHPAGKFLSTNWTFYTDATADFIWNGKVSSSNSFSAGTQVSFGYNGYFSFPETVVISYDQRKLYEIPAGTILKTPDYVPEVQLSTPPRGEPAAPTSCIEYRGSQRKVHCVIDDDKQSKGAYTSVNVSVKGNGSATATAKVEGCKAIATASAVVIGSGSASAKAVARAWGCK